mmetsp:Transcript_3549/g.8904  ORF Transcript_3549/g.8904 Transcript_3549/m.8904 type:complete len:208 (+) Transcript_3549:393-1016(+)
MARPRGRRPVLTPRRPTRFVATDSRLASSASRTMPMTEESAGHRARPMDLLHLASRRAWKKLASRRVTTLARKLARRRSSTSRGAGTHAAQRARWRPHRSLRMARSLRSPRRTPKLGGSCRRSYRAVTCGAAARGGACWLRRTAGAPAWAARTCERDMVPHMAVARMPHGYGMGMGYGHGYGHLGEPMSPEHVLPFLFVRSAWKFVC